LSSDYVHDCVRVFGFFAKPWEGYNRSGLRRECAEYGYSVEASSMAKREKEGKVHMHEYDDNWQCKCGFRLITDTQGGGAVVNIKAYVTPDGQKVALRHERDDEAEREAEEESGAEPDTETEIETEIETDASPRPRKKKGSE